MQANHNADHHPVCPLHQHKRSLGGSAARPDQTAATSSGPGPTNPSTPPERIMLALLCAAMATVVMTGLMLADKASWPAALIVGLGAGGATLVGVITFLGRSNSS